MAAFGAGANRPLPGRGASPGFRFTLYAALSIVLMFLDQRHAWLEQVRYALSAAAYPLQLAVSSPAAAWNWLEQSFTTREALRAENARLRERERVLELRTLRFEALARENEQLRGLKTTLPPVADRWLAAEVINVDLNSLRQRLLINRGARNGVFKGQAVVDSTGLIGQTIHVGPWSAEIILVTDPEHAVPVEIERTGVRTIAVGSGDAESLALPYLPSNADVKSGDLLLTSGLGGVFPQGYPVARITDVHRDSVQPLAQIRATPLARLDRVREVTLVWFREDHPAAPPRIEDGQTLHGNAGVGPQPAPPRPVAPKATAPLSPAPAPAVGAATASNRAAPAATGGPTASIKAAPAASTKTTPVGKAPAPAPDGAAASPAEAADTDTD